MTYYDLTKKDQKKLKNKKPVHRSKKKKKERLSEYDLRELMGTNRDTYHKVNRRVRRK